MWRLCRRRIYLVKIRKILKFNKKSIKTLDVILLYQYNLM